MSGLFGRVLVDKMVTVCYNSFTLNEKGIDYA